VRPNPWFFVPVLVSLLVGGALGWMIAGVSCPDGCVVSQTVTAVLVGGAVAAGVGVVAVLGIRSIAEADAHRAVGQEPPGPGCEVPPDPE
jgi:hypothetical protein